MVETKDGALYDGESEANSSALEDLRDVLDHIGFKVHKKRSSEDTLRVYLVSGRPYPLLNPRFVRRSFSGLKGRDFLEVNVLSKGDEELDRRLRAYAPTTSCAFFPDGSKSPPYFYHGVFAVPLHFRDKVCYLRRPCSVWLQGS